MNDRNRSAPTSWKGNDSRRFPTESTPAVDVNKAFKALEDLKEPKNWIKENNSRILINEVCDPLGQAFSRSVNTSQIRKFLNEVQRLDKDFHIEKVPFLQAKLAYATGRNRKLEPFQQIVNFALEKIRDKEDFNGFKELILGIIAYHKFYGGD